MDEQTNTAKSVYEQRNYKVLTGKQAKEIVGQYLCSTNFDGTSYFGLAEPNDRYHEWKVPVLAGQNEHLGDVYVSAYSSEVNLDRSTDIEVMNQRVEQLPASDIDITKNTKKKRTYSLSPLGNTVCLGDCLSVMENMPDNSAELIFTSPPYYNARPQYREYATYEEYLEFINSIIKESSRVLSDGRFFVMNISHVLVPRVSRNQSSTRIAVPFDFHRLFIENDFEFIDDIIWVKPEGAGWASGRGRRFAADRNPLQYKAVPVTEYVLVYRKKSNELIDWFIRNHPDPDVIQNSKIEDGYETTNLWEISPARSKHHPAIFPVELAEKVISYYSFEGDVVLDPFGGIGTVGTAALNKNRKFFLIERKEEYLNHFIANEKRFSGEIKSFKEGQMP